MGTVDTSGMSSYQCLRVTLVDTVVILAKREMIAAVRVLDKCDQGGLAILEPTPEFILVVCSVVPRLDSVI